MICVTSKPKTDFSINIPIAQRKATRTCTKHPISNYVSYKNQSPYCIFLGSYFRASCIFLGFISQLSSMDEPKNIQEALNVPESREVVFKEMKALKKNGTWEKVNLLEGKTPVGYKWVLGML